MENQRQIFVVSAPSGVGKTTLNRRLLEEFPQQISMSVSLTTRAMRSGEKDGEHYRFVSRSEFEKAVEEGKMLEWAEVFGNLYGTSLDEVERIKQSDRNVLLEIDVQGWHYARKKIPEAKSIFIMPPDIDSLWKRLKSRGTESQEMLERRFLTAREEISEGHKFAHFIINDNLEAAYKELKNIVIFRKDSMCSPDQGIKHCQLLLNEFDQKDWIQEMKVRSIKSG